MMGEALFLGEHKYLSMSVVGSNTLNFDLG